MYNNPAYKALLKCIRAEATDALSHMPEDTPIEGNALHSGDPAEDAKQEQWIRDQLASGNEWAWCCAVVEITWCAPAGTRRRGTQIRDAQTEYTEREYLGCCSYTSEAEFIECGERASMRDEACIHLAQRLYREWERLNTVIHGAR